MKRYVWLLLLISLGFNIGLGWRLVRQHQQAEDQWTQGWRGDRDGHPRWMDREGGRRGEGRRERFQRPAPGDTTAWREVMNHRIARMARKLELTPEQIESFRAAFEESAVRFRSRRARIEQLEKKLRDLSQASPVQPDSIRATIHALSHARTSLDSLVTESMLKELDSLAPEQRGQYLRMLPWSQIGRGGGPGSKFAGEPEPPVPGE